MKIAIGSANFGIKYGIFGNTKISKDQILKIEKLLVNKNIKYVDTAHNYFRSEEIIGKSKLKKLKIITKFNISHKNKLINVEKQLENIIFKSLNRLKVKKIETILIHNSRDILRKEGYLLLESLKKFKKKGLVKNIGISIYDPSELKKIWKTWKPDVVQAPLNVFDQRILYTGWIDILKQNKIKFFARSCFLQGIIIGDYKKLQLPKKLLEHLNYFNLWCEVNKISRVKACLDFIRQFKNVHCIVLGYNNSDQLNYILKELDKKKEKYH